ncbi:DNA adenine methylase [Segatella oris F0302]|jgi:DNA adenine methylase|uniref:Site-specific DNA-methyltransferase (adenine-specific) n=1 Tax=Segatella oris F0302 TaxID=649760 RepID=D1QVF3_9BACT|nr:Dam family site-specific DNA-(adenine-N6)-methyltransferase [Segatella oris]EFB30674.1 DNA adenine methylase [Segatella oris F0302]MBF1449249.1 Dam family site-specific DNA-(adenine-N6)-methyltransferase [Segatella oris]
MVVKNNQQKLKVTKPFVKWAGGKGSLVKHLSAHLPDNFRDKRNVTYVEPFVGGGAMLFYMLTHFTNIRRVVINDVNEDLIFCYKLIKNTPQTLIEQLKRIANEYLQLSNMDEKSRYYYKVRDKYNSKETIDEEKAAYFMFLNKTCFNGLYRVNTCGKFNVPFGKYKNPTICDDKLILADHELLKKVDIYTGDYSEIMRFLGKGYNYIYIDPPYRPLSGTAYFKEYSHNVFDDKEQEKLKIFCDIMTARGCKIMQSNSNSMDDDGESYFAKLYQGYHITQIEAHRYINAHVGKRNKETELLIMNYNNK